MGYYSRLKSRFVLNNVCCGSTPGGATLGNTGGGLTTTRTTSVSLFWQLMDTHARRSALSHALRDNKHVVQQQQQYHVLRQLHAQLYTTL